MAVKKPKENKSGFNIGDFLKFIESQAIGPKAQGLFQEAADIKVPPMGAGKDVFGIAPQTQAYIAKGGKGIEALANTGLGQWFGADSAFNLGKNNQSGMQQFGNLANLLFAFAPLGSGKVAKVAGKKLKKTGQMGAKTVGGQIPNDVKNLLNLLMGNQQG